MHSYATWRQSAHSGDSRSRAKAKRSKRSSLSIWRIHKPVTVAFGKTTGRCRPARRRSPAELEYAVRLSNSRGQPEQVTATTIRHQSPPKSSPVARFFAESRQPAVQQRSSGNGGEHSFGDLESRCRKDA